MAKLPRYSLAYNAKSKKWELKSEGSGSVVTGSVRIRKRNGKIQEERTYPRSMDPRGLG